MPKYAYHCNKCDGDFEKRHGISETLKICEICDASDFLVRVPSSIFLANKTPQFDGENKPGEVVKQTIEEAKRDLITDQNRLKERTYKK